MPFCFPARSCFEDDYELLVSLGNNYGFISSNLEENYGHCQ